MHAVISTLSGRDYLMGAHDRRTDAVKQMNRIRENFPTRIEECNSVQAGNTLWGDAQFTAPVRTVHKGIPIEENAPALEAK